MKKKTLGIVIAALAIVVAGLIVFIILSNSNFSLSDTKVEVNETQTITYLEKDKEIALVTLGIAEIIDETHSQIIFGFEVPWSNKQVFMKASYTAKLGIDGNEVEITQIGENEYQIYIPKFIFIGYADPAFEHVVDNNGVLSFTTENIDQAGMITNMFSPENQEKYIEQYLPLLKESAEEFYNNLVPSFAEGVKLTFVYGE